jgi:hypothetical protein
MDSERHEHIEAYLSGALNAAEVAAFEKEMESHAALRREVDLHRMAEVAIQHGLRVSQKQRLQDIDAELNTARPGRILLIRRLAAAASVLLLIAVGAHFYAHGTYSNTAVADRFYAPVKNEVFRGEEQVTGTTATLFKEAQNFYESGTYNQAIERYLTIIQQNDLQKDQAEWNLLMCYLAMEPSGSRFAIMLDHIAQNPEHAYYQKSLELQQTMKGTLYRLVND